MNEIPWEIQCFTFFETRNNITSFIILLPYVAFCIENSYLYNRKLSSKGKAKVFKFFKCFNGSLFSYFRELKVHECFILFTLNLSIHIKLLALTNWLNESIIWRDNENEHLYGNSFWSYKYEKKTHERSRGLKLVWYVCILRIWRPKSNISGVLTNTN